MSSALSTSASHSNLDSIFNSALQTYKKKTSKDITSHPLATELQSCNSPDAILAVLRKQVPSFDQSQDSNGTFTKWLIPTINVLYAFSATVGEGVGLVNQMISHLVEIICSNIYLSGILSGKNNLAGIGVLLLVSLFQIHCVAYFDT
jgi:hypothetical protein